MKYSLLICTIALFAERFLIRGAGEPSEKARQTIKKSETAEAKNDLDRTINGDEQW